MSSLFPVRRPFSVFVLRSLAWLFLVFAGLNWSPRQALATVSVTITPSNPTVCTSTTTRFTANWTVTSCTGTQGAVSYQWILNGGYIAGATLSYIDYTAPATPPSSSPVLACLVSIVNCGSGTGSTTIAVQSGGPTVTTPTFSPSSPTTCTTIQFHASASEPCGSGSFTYDWDWGDGTTHGTGTSPTHRYAQPSSQFGYDVTVTASDGTQSASSNVFVVVTSGPVAPTNLIITGNTYNLITLAWTASPAATSYKIYKSTSNGPYQLLATVSGTTYADSAVAPQTYYCYYVVGVDACGTSGANSSSYCATTPCHDNFTMTASASPTAAKVGQSITFTGSASGTCGGTITYNWDFGDGTNATTATAMHSYGNAGSYTVTLYATDGTTTSSQTITMNVYALGRPLSPGDPYGAGGGPGGGTPGEDSGNFPGSPGDPHYRHCEHSCLQGSDALGYTTVCTDTYSGNTRMWRKDPIRTRGYPINCDVTINSQTVYFNRPMGNAAFSYDIFVSQMKVYDGSCNSTQHWCVVDGDGTQLDFGVASAAPQSTQSIFSSLQVLRDANNNITGYQLLHAGEPEHLKSYGNFTYSFNALGQLTQLTDPQGNPQTFTYDTSNRLVGILDVNTGKTATLDYNGSGLVQDVLLNGGGIKNKFAYVSGMMTGQTVTDSTDHLISSVSIGNNADGSFSSITPDGNAGRQLQFAYKPAPSTDCSSVIPVTTGYGATPVSTITYTGPKSADAADTVYVKNAQGGTVKCDYNARLDLFRLTEPTPAGATTAPVYTFTYNSDHECLTMADGSTATVTMTYNATGVQSNPGTGYLTGIKDRSNNTWSWGWNGADMTTSQDPVEAAASASESLAYGDTAQPHVPTTETDSLGNTWSFQHNTHGQVTQVTPPSGSTEAPSTITYDEGATSATRGYPTLFTDGNGDKVSIDAYDALGDVLQVSSYPVSGSTTVKNTTTYAYDAAQRVTQVTLPDNHTVQAVYNGNDLDHVIDPSGAQYNYSYCASCGALTGITGPSGWGMSWTLDDDKDLTTFTDPNSHVTTYTYGPAEELQQIAYPDNTTNSYSYNNYFLPATLTNGRGDSITVTYDNDERIRSFTFPTTSQAGLYYDYNADGTVHDFIDGLGTTTLIYYTNGWLKHVTYDYRTGGLTNPQQLDYTYYPDGKRQTMTWTNGSVVVGTWTYAYDIAGNLHSVVSPWSETTQWSYDGEDKLTTQTNANGTSTTYGYNQARGWPTSIAHKAGTTNLATYGLTYDGGSNTIGNLTAVTENGSAAAAYSYNSLNRLTSDARTGTNAYSHTYDFDLAGNRTNIDGTVVTYDAANKITAWGSYATFSYDQDGNWLSNGTFTFAYDDLNHLIHTHATATDPDMTFAYDARGLRVMSQPASGTATFYVYDGNTLLGEVQSTTVTAAYTWGVNGPVSERLLPSSSSPKSLWYHFGPQGETRLLTNSAGSVVDTYSYTAYGRNVASTGTDTNPFQFGGQFGYYLHPAAPNSGYLCGHRWYSPAYASFFTKDPIGYSGGPDLYAYCDGDPVNAADPSGWDVDYENGDISGVGNYATLDLSSFYSAETFVDNIWNNVPAYSAVTAASGKDMFGRCLSNSDRVMRGISAALPLLGKLRFGKFCFGGCFVDGTPVQMADGTTKPVEQIKEGDLVLSKDEQTGIISAKRVTGTSTRMVPVVETVNLADDAGKVIESLTVTGDHPFYVEGEGFLAASQLPAGIKVETKTGTLTVSSTERHETAQGYVVHNFTVDGDHSYFVGTASGGAWVHNSIEDCTKIAKDIIQETGQGAIWNIRPRVGRLINGTKWFYHDVVRVGDMIIDPMKRNGNRTPIHIDEWKKLYDDAFDAYHSFTPGSGK